MQLAARFRRREAYSAVEWPKGRSCCTLSGPNAAATIPCTCICGPLRSFAVLCIPFYKHIRSRVNAANHGTSHTVLCGPLRSRGQPRTTSQGFHAHDWCTVDGRDGWHGGRIPILDDGWPNRGCGSTRSASGPHGLAAHSKGQHARGTHGAAGASTTADRSRPARRWHFRNKVPRTQQ